MESLWDSRGGSMAKAQKRATKRAATARAGSKPKRSSATKASRTRKTTAPRASKRVTATKSSHGSTARKRSVAGTMGKRTTRAATPKPATSTRKQDAVALLKADHREVEKLFAKYERLGDGASKTKKDVVQRIVRELSI